MFRFRSSLHISLLLIVLLPACSNSAKTTWDFYSPREPLPFLGTWRLNMAESSDIDPWRGMMMEFRQLRDGFAFIVTRNAEPYSQRDSLHLRLDNLTHRHPVQAGKWQANVYMGVFSPEDGNRLITSRFQPPDRLQLRIDAVMGISQGSTRVTRVLTLTLVERNQKMIWLEKRPTRQHGPAIRYVFERTHGGGV